MFESSNYILVGAPSFLNLHFSTVFHQTTRMLRGAKGCGSVKAASRFGTTAATGACMAGAGQR
jgi:hypothetical protein